MNITLTPEQRRPIFNAAKQLGVRFNVQEKVDVLDAGINQSLALIGIATPAASQAVVIPPAPPSIEVVPSAPGPDGLSWGAMLAVITNPHAVALTDADYEQAAAKLGHGVTLRHMKASKKVEAPRGSFDDHGRPSILYERHVFSRNTHPKGRFNASHPELSALNGYGPGGYGSFDAQYGKLERAYALEPEAAFEACSWGAFQVLGENAMALGYPSAREMAVELAKSEAAHLDCYVRFIQTKGLAAALGACRPGDPDSCIPFVEGYNGHGFRAFSYHVHFAQALL
jgi:hypothetical protein